MPESYTVQLSFRSEAASGRELLADIGEDILGWVTRDEFELGGSFPYYGKEEMPSLGHFAVDGAVSGNSEWWRTEWSRPDSQGRPIDWVSSARLATLGDEVECGLRVRVKAREGFITGDYASVAPPRIVPELVEKPGFRASCMGEVVSASPTHLTGPRVGRFVSERLEDATRRLPIVMVSADDVTGRSPVDIHKLSGQLSGLAEVALLHDGEAAWELTKQVGQKYSCFSGATRVYWPGFNSHADDPFSHRLWLRDRIADHGPAAFARLLFNFLCSRVGRAFGDSPVWREVHRDIQVQREEGWRQQLNDLGADKELTELVLESIQADMRGAAAERDDAIELATSLDSLLGETERERDNFARENEQLRVALAHGGRQHAEAAPAPPQVETVLDAVQAASSLPNTTVLDSAVDSARESRSNRGSDLYKVLCVLDRLAVKYREGLGNRGVRAWLEEELQDVSVQYKAGISSTTEGKRGQAYTFGNILMGKHLSFGGGHNTANHVSVHFEFDFPDDPPRCVIGHAGKHLPNEMS